MKSSGNHVELLDYIRGVAILAVLFDHTFSNIFGYDTLPWNGWFRDFSVPTSFLCLLPLNFGSAGVALFFVVSGFCIHMSYEQQGRKWGGFFVRRIFRIYPAYLAALLFFTVLFMQQTRLSFHDQQIWTLHTFQVPWTAGAFWTQLLSHLFLVHNWHPLTFSGITGAFWSLAIEAQLYLLYPVLLALVAKIGWRRVMVVLAGCELLIRGLDGAVQTAGASDSVAGIIAGVFSRSPLGFWFSWALGACIADAFLKNQPLPFRKSSPFLWLALAVASYFVKPLAPFMFLLFAVATAVATGKLLAGAASKTEAPAFPPGLLKRIGLWSYSIYLLHQPLLNICSDAVARTVPGEYRSATVTFLLLVAAWLAVIPFSYLWYRVFELPGIALGKRIIAKSGPGQKRMLTGGHYLMIAALVLLVAGTFWANAELKRPDPVEENNLAWSLASSPEAAKRNGTLAVKLAQDACQQTQGRVTAMVGTLGAAYAEAGRFDEAVSMAQKACQQAEKNGETDLLQKNRELQALYLKHQPFHEIQSGAAK